MLTGRSPSTCRTNVAAANAGWWAISVYKNMQKSIKSSLSVEKKKRGLKSSRIFTNDRHHHEWYRRTAGEKVHAIRITKNLKRGSCPAASFPSELSSRWLSPLTWHKNNEAPIAHMPSSLLPGQLSNQRNPYASWVEQAAHVPAGSQLLQSCAPTLSPMTSLTVCLPAGAW